MEKSPIYCLMSSFDRLPRLIATQYIPGKAPRYLFDGEPSGGIVPDTQFMEMPTVIITGDETRRFVDELFGPDHRMMYDMECGRPWAVVEPVHNIIVSVIMGDNGFEIGFHRRQLAKPPAPTPDAPTESN
jgi:hypothetical protein